MKRAALYERVSTDAQAEKYGLGSQDRALKARAEERSYTLVSDGERDAFIDDSFSGSDVERPALGRLRQAVKGGHVDAILCYDPDRLSRNLSDLLLLTDEFERAGACVEFITQDTDASPEGKMFFAMRGAVAEYERAKIRERTIRGRLEKARQGKVISRVAAPFGYRYDPATSTLTIDEPEAEVVRLVFYLYTQEHLSMIKLADRLNRMGIKRPEDGRQWYLSFLGRLLRNEAYTGVLWQNRWRSEKISAMPGKKATIRNVQRPRGEQIMVTIPPIISREMFDAAQKRIEENLRLASRNAKREYLLSGLIRHACGSAMSGRTHQGRYFYYCVKSLSSHAPIDDNGQLLPCSCKWVNGATLEAVVWNTVTSLLKQPELLIEELEKLTRPNSITREALQSELKQIIKRLQEIPLEERRLVEGYRKGFYADFMMAEEKERVTREQATAEQRQIDLGQQLERLDRALTYRGRVEEFARRVGQGLDGMNFIERRELLRLLVDSVTYDDGQVIVRTIIPIDGGDSEAVQLYPTSQRIKERGRSPSLSLSPVEGERTCGLPLLSEDNPWITVMTGISVPHCQKPSVSSKPDYG
ncbi:MAG: recombinase family protein [Chloroflexi bacterium]|nr:recombinase family protein [Chloroflexota bacterium]